MTECQWFLLCNEQAQGHVQHPVLGRVPTCRRCAVKHDLDLVLDLAYVEQHNDEWRMHYQSAVVGRHRAKYKALAQADAMNTRTQSAD